MEEREKERFERADEELEGEELAPQAEGDDASDDDEPDVEGHAFR